MTPYEKIRKALNTGDSCDLLTAMDALAELERASKEPVATVCLITDRFAHNHCIEAQLQVSPDTQLPIGTKLYTAPPPAPVAEMREPVEVSDEAADRVAWLFYGVSTIGNSSDMREVLGYWRRELGPTLGLVEMREPTPEECERIAFEYHGHGHVQRVSNGRRMFDAVRRVMWPKGGES